MTEEIQQLLFTFPTWDAGIWEPLQTRSYAKVQRGLEEAFANISEEDIGQLNWQGLIIGSPAIRGEVKKEEWEENVLPLLAKLVVKNVHGSILGPIYQSLSFRSRNNFHKKILNSIEGNSVREKFEWLKGNNASLYVFFLGSLDSSLRDSRKKNSIMPSYEKSRHVFSVAYTNGLEGESIAKLADIISKTLEGNVSKNELGLKIQKVLFVKPEIAQKIAREIDLDKLGEKIKEPKTPLDIEPSADVPTAPISLKEEPASVTKTLKVQKEGKSPEDTPLILHREVASSAKRSTAPGTKGFTLPFGMFKSKSDFSRSIKDPVKASIETPPEYIKKLREKTEGASKRIKPEKKRVIHYNELRTPLTPFSKESQFIKTGSFGDSKKPEPKSPLIPEKKPFTKPIPQKPTPVGESKTKGFAWFKKKAEAPVKKDFSKKPIKPFEKKQEIKKIDVKQSVKPIPTKPQMRKSFVSKDPETKKGGIVWFKKDSKKKEEKKDSPTVQGNTVDLRKQK